MLKASDPKTFCKVGPLISDSCSERTCYDAGDLKTDKECNDFLLGWVTRGNGCISSMEPCYRYSGTEAVCQSFKGNGMNCWNTAEATTFTNCKEKMCSDDIDSTTD